jgi:hypothetical protein
MNYRLTGIRGHLAYVPLPDVEDGQNGGAGDGAADKGVTDGAGAEYKAPASQADLDRIIGERVARERAKFADYGDLKTKAAAHDQALEAAKTEQEKAVDAARKEGEQTATERSHARLVGAEARALAAEAKFRNPAIAVRSIDLAGVKVGADGEVDAEAIKAALKTLADSDPYLVDDGKPAVVKPRPDLSQGGGGATDDKPSVSAGRDLYRDRHGKKTA